MAIQKHQQSNVRVIEVSSKKDLSQADRDLIVDLFNEIAWRNRTDLIILHDVIESKRYCQLIVEANTVGLTHLVSEFKRNLDCKVAVISERSPPASKSLARPRKVG